MHKGYIGGRFRQMIITHKASDVAENLQLYRVIRFFHPRSSCTTMHTSADIHRITFNVYVRDDLWWKNQTTRYILPHHWLYE